MRYKILRLFKCKIARLPKEKFFITYLVVFFSDGLLSNEYRKLIAIKKKLVWLYKSRQIGVCVLAKEQGNDADSLSLIRN